MSFPDPSLCDSLIILSLRIMSLPSVCPGNAWLCTVWVCAGQCLSPLFHYSPAKAGEHIYILPQGLRHSRLSINICWVNDYKWKNFLTSSSINQKHYHVPVMADGRTGWGNPCKTPHSPGTQWISVPIPSTPWFLLILILPRGTFPFKKQMLERKTGLMHADL